jgi:hypothetical protein
MAIAIAMASLIITTGSTVCQEAYGAIQIWSNSLFLLHFKLQ